MTFSLALLGLLPGCMGRGDALAPMITITEPQGGAVRAGSDLRIVGYALDDGGITSIRVDGTEILDARGYAGERGKKLINFGFRPRRVREGLWRSELVVTDVDGRSTQFSFPLEIDGTPPTVEITGVEGLSGGRNRVSGVARDNDLVSRITFGEGAAEGDTAGEDTAGEDTLSFTPAAQVPFTFETDGDTSVRVTDQAGNVTTFTP